MFYFLLPLLAMMAAPLHPVYASQLARQCLKDSITIERLKSEIQALEIAQAESEAATLVRMNRPSVWRGLSVAGFSNSEIDFLLKAEPWIFSGVDFANSNCQNVPCVLNRVYLHSEGISGTQNSSLDRIEGYYIYRFFLSTGYVVSTTNRLPSQRSNLPGIYREKEHALSSYLFNQNELKLLYRVSLDMPKAYRNMKVIQTFNRIPRGSEFERNGYGTCGIATAGSISLSDPCIQPGYLKDGWRDGVVNITHELSHAYDYEMGEKVPFSEASEDWLSMSGWKYEEKFYQYPEITDHVAGRIEKKWIRNRTENSDICVTWYACTDPAEDFAESVAYYRYSAEDFAARMPRKAKFLAELIFEGKAFGRDRLYEQYVLRLSEKVKSTGAKTETNRKLELQKALGELYMTDTDACDVIVDARDTYWSTGRYKMNDFKYTTEKLFSDVLKKSQVSQ